MTTYSLVDWGKLFRGNVLPQSSGIYHVNGGIRFIRNLRRHLPDHMMSSATRQCHGTLIIYKTIVFTEQANNPFSNRSLASTNSDKVNVKFSPLQALEALKVVRG
jgi:hypothetical protein